MGSPTPPAPRLTSSADEVLGRIREIREIREQSAIKRQRERRMTDPLRPSGAMANYLRLTGRNSPTRRALEGVAAMPMLQTPRMLQDLVNSPWKRWLADSSTLGMPSMQLQRSAVGTIAELAGSGLATTALASVKAAEHARLASVRESASVARFQITPVTEMFAVRGLSAGALNRDSLAAARAAKLRLYGDPLASLRAIGPGVGVHRAFENWTRWPLGRDLAGPQLGLSKMHMELAGKSMAYGPFGALLAMPRVEKMAAVNGLYRLDLFASLARYPLASGDYERVRGLIETTRLLGDLTRRASRGETAVLGQLDLGLITPVAVEEEIRRAPAEASASAAPEPLIEIPEPGALAALLLYTAQKADAAREWVWSEPLWAAASISKLWTGLNEDDQAALRDRSEGLAVALAWTVFFILQRQLLASAGPASAAYMQLRALYRQIRLLERKQQDR